MKNIHDMSFKISSEVTAHEIGDGTFIYNNKRGTCFGLEGIGLEIWQMICEGKTVGEIIDSIQDNYDVDKGAISRDVHSFVNRLTENHLLDM